jgi:hypothetical protein
LRTLDPLTKGSIVHEVQARVLRDLKARDALPIDADRLDLALERLDVALEAVVTTYHDRLAPAIERVWEEEIAAIRLDLRTWIREAAAAGRQWVPELFEFAFGLPRRDDHHDPGSIADPVLVDGRFLLHGAVDVIERHATNGTLRITDHKTGRSRVRRGARISGGTVLQPILYSLVVEKVFEKPVAEARLYFCTTPGNFESHGVPIDGDARKLGVEVLEIVDRAIERGHLPAYPAEGSCRWCDFTSVCGPHEERRVARKAAAAPLVTDLIALRGRP